MNALAQDSKGTDTEAPGKGGQGAGGPSSDLFYKQKDTERNVLSGNEDDFWDEPDSVVAEIKASKKANIKVSESDFEQEAHNQQQTEQRKLTRQSEVRNSKRGMLSSNEPQNTSTSSNQKKSNNFVNSDRNKRIRNQKLAEDSMTEQSEDDRRLEGQRHSDSQRFRMGSRGPPRTMNERTTTQTTKTTQGGNITNIINNNNINNIIINDPTKAPPVFHMAAGRQHINDPRMQGVDVGQ